MKFLITSPLFPPARFGGGPIRSIEAMLKNADPRHEVRVLANNYDLGQHDSLVPPGNRWEEFGRTHVMYLNRGSLSWVQGLRTALSVRPDVYYLNGLFNVRFSIAMQMVSSLSPKTLVSIAPRGELNPGALNLKSPKKEMFLRAAQKSGLHDAVIWHASSELEAENIRRYFDNARVVVRGNDTLLPQVATPPRERRSGPLRTVFMSRLSPTKGLDVAMEALTNVRRPVTLDVVGPEEDRRYVEECRLIVERAPSHVTIRFVGPVMPEQMRNILANYDLMVLPTAGENFGHAIGEALSTSLPVMLTDVTPWSSWVRVGGGVLMDDRDPLKWAQKLSDYAAEGPEVWMARRHAAGRVYNSWKSEAAQPHFFDQLEAEVCS